MTNFRLLQIQSTCRRQNVWDSKIEILVGQSKKRCWKRGNASFQSFEKLSFPKGVKSRDCVVQSLLLNVGLVQIESIGR